MGVCNVTGHLLVDGATSNTSDVMMPEKINVYPTPICWTVRLGAITSLWQHILRRFVMLSCWRQVQPQVMTSLKSSSALHIANLESQMSPHKHALQSVL